MQPTQDWQGEDLGIISMWRNRPTIPFWNLLLNALMWPRLIEVLDISTQDTLQLLLLEDEQVIQTLASHTAQKAFTDGIGSRGVIRRFENLDTAGCGHARETGSKLAITITDEIPRSLSKGSRFPQLLCCPGIGRRASDAHMDDSPRVQIDDEEGLPANERKGL